MNWHSMKFSEVLKKLDVSPEKGLSSSEVKKRRLVYGYNALKEEKQRSFWQKLKAQFSDFMVIILILAAVISLITSFLSSESDYIDTIIILSIVIINTIIGMLQESKAEKEINSLKKLATPLTKVIRDSRVQRISTEDLVPGDILTLSTGDLVPADARIIESSNLAAEESAMTGESFASQKSEDKIFDSNTPPADQKNMLFSGSVIDRGNAKAVVVRTGMNTEIGKVTQLINTDEISETPLQKRLSSTGKITGICIIVISIIVFILGAMQNINLMEMFMISISLAVAAIPEGLPAVVTIVLANGVRRMTKKNTIVRKLPAIETLGHATVICSDKTGTLTLNKMVVTEIRDIENQYNLNDKFSKKLFEMAMLCNNSTVTRNHGDISAHGEPTENALLMAGIKCGLSKKNLNQEYPRIKELPFDSKRKLMSTVNRTPDNKYEIITKGAPEFLVKICKYYFTENGVKLLDAKTLKKINSSINQMAKKSLRTIAIAYKEEYDRNENQEEKDLIFYGIVGIMDPPRPEAERAVLECKGAGIKTVMITGDYVETAKAIATKLHIFDKNSVALTGSEINELSDEELREKVKNCTVFARVSPEHKVRIVKAFQANGEIVAMTGDGVNDAPALKVADIGCAMGKSGTDAAKSASDIIMADDNFVSVVEAVRQGRGMYDNIKKTIHFLLSTNIGEVAVVLFGFLMRTPPPLLAIHLLWINLVTDAFPALALGMDPIDKNIMKRPPIDSKKSLFSGGLTYNIIIEGCFIAAMGILSFSIGRAFFDLDPYNPVIGRTMAFVSLGLSQLIQTFNVQSRKSLLVTGILSNFKLIYSVVFCMILQIIVVTIPVFNVFFKTSHLNIFEWIIVWLLASFPLVVSELEKYIARNKKQISKYKDFFKNE